MSISWSRIARRIRVPMGFVLAALFLWLARPSGPSIAWSLILVAPGIALRAYASGYVKKNAELTVTGPYAYTRNPLYLGSVMIGMGFAIAARSLWIAAVLVIFFVVIYVPVIRSEEEFLRRTFPEYESYARRVPRLFPRVVRRQTAAETGVFSMELYRKHREYNALMGSLAIYAALGARILLISR